MIVLGDRLQVEFKFKIYTYIITNTPSIHMKRTSMGKYVVHLINSMLILLFSLNLAVKHVTKRGQKHVFEMGVHKESKLDNQASKCSKT